MIDQQLLADVGPDDLQRLLSNRVPESRSLEYKQSLPGGNDADRKEFLADVSSFGNATGGDLIYGIAEAERSRSDGPVVSTDRADARTAQRLRLASELVDRYAPTSRAKVGVLHRLGLMVAALDGIPARDCRSCGTRFEPRLSEGAFYRERMLSFPTHCAACRAQRRQERADREQRQPDRREGEQA
jgi:hypothetical protein